MVASGKIYASASGHAGKYIFSPAVVTPNVTTGVASGTEPTAITLNGQVEPDDS